MADNYHSLKDSGSGMQKSKQNKKPSTISSSFEAHLNIKMVNCKTWKQSSTYAGLPSTAPAQHLLPDSSEAVQHGCVRAPYPAHTQFVEMHTKARRPFWANLHRMEPLTVLFWFF